VRTRRNWAYWLRLLTFGLVVGALMFFLGVNLVWVEAVVRPAHRAICCQTPADLGYVYEAVTLTGGDGLTLAGWYLPARTARGHHFAVFFAPAFVFAFARL